MARRRVEDSISLANQAELLLEDPVLQKAREDVKEGIYRMWLDAKSLDDREKLHGTALGFELFYSTLEGYVRTGEVDLHNEQLRQQYEVT